jgi:hypothetical protein
MAPTPVILWSDKHVSLPTGGNDVVLEGWSAFACTLLKCYPTRGNAPIRPTVVSDGLRSPPVRSGILFLVVRLVDSFCNCRRGLVRYCRERSGVATARRVGLAACRMRGWTLATQALRPHSCARLWVAGCPQLGALRSSVAAIGLVARGKWPCLDSDGSHLPSDLHSDAGLSLQPTHQGALLTRRRRWCLWPFTATLTA